MSNNIVDDDNRPMRTGTWVTWVIGSGVVSLAWAIGQLGWIAGPAVLVAFSLVTLFTSSLLADAYRHTDPVTGPARNYTYMDAVRAQLGGRKVQLCGLAQCINLVGVNVGYTVTAAISMAAVESSWSCFHDGFREEDKCDVSSTRYMIIYGFVQLVLCQVPNFQKLSWISILAAVMSATYSVIGLGLSVAKVAGGGTKAATTTVGLHVSEGQELWRVFRAIGDIAFAYSYSTVLIEIQDTLRSSPPENRTMKRASFVGITVTTFFYLLCDCVGYAAFGKAAPGNLLSGTGFRQPLWLVNIANICVAVHLVGAYQVFCQPIFSFVESRCRQRWPESKFVTMEHPVTVGGGTTTAAVCHVNLFRLVWRSAYVVVTTALAMTFPFFNDFLSLVGAASFWPLTVYFPVAMYISRAKIPKFSFTWAWLQCLSWACLVVSLVVAAGSVEGLIQSMKKYHPFKN